MSKIENPKRNYVLKVNGDRYETKSLRRFLNHVRTVNWKKPQIKVYLRVSYGMVKDVFWKMQTFYNDGTYDNYEDFKLELDAFLE